LRSNRNDNNFENIIELLKYFDSRKLRAQARLEQLKYSEQGWYFGILGVADCPYTELSIGRIQRIEEPPGEVELAEALLNSEIFSHVGRYSKALTYELFIRSDESYNDKIFDVAWWLISTLRIKSNSDFLIPVAANCSWSVIPGMPRQTVKIKIIEDMPRARIYSKIKITQEDIKWVDNNFINFAHLLSDARFRTAVDAFTTHHQQTNSRMAVALLWSGLEAIFGIQSELRFRLAAQIASLIEQRGIKRIELHRQVKKLYDFRSKAVHGSSITDEMISEHVTAVRNIFSRILSGFIENRKIPSIEEFEEMIFL
jgi:hypothetical protein